MYLTKIFEFIEKENKKVGDFTFQMVYNSTRSSFIIEKNKKQTQTD